ncbi:ABC transporter substrate-binding protein [Bifidobacterium sp. ESL0798]|uniref:ABC transporter substrate-binding protein n=1 Tax=Bifidobacterium sp. ESL0798 TaxID=2983235 RepID=UPI0023F911E5|nr:ABC transporter substrate-binding protein [Bifidobacterium sp. ESL0798]WEV73905.1 ABC transporter substrate-binding protein [Bifidobacterium sp. ESL0798]
MKRGYSILAAGLALAMCASMGACGSSSKSSDTAAADGVYYLNNKPEIASSMKELGEEYTKQTGVPFTVQTAASGTYAQTLKSELAKSAPPTLFMVEGPVMLNRWKNYAGNMSDTEVYKQLKDQTAALKSSDGSQVLSVPVVTETYGLIYRKDLLKKYFDMPGASIKSVKDIKDYKSLKTVADEIQANKNKLGVKGAFTSMGFDPSTSWRWNTHLMNIPLAYEFEKDHITSQTATVKGTYLPQFKQITDLYLKDSTTPASELSGKNMNDATDDLTSGQAVFFQNGSWAWPDLVQGGMKADQIGAIPIYTGIEGESEHGMSTGSETFWCINKKASPKAQKATKDFLKWLITSDTGRKTWSKTMGFTTQFKTFTGKYASDNPIMQSSEAYRKAGKKNVAWDFVYNPSDQWKNNLSDAILEYAQGTGNWDKVKTAFVDKWATEYKAAAGAKS